MSAKQGKFLGLQFILMFEFKWNNPKITIKYWTIKDINMCDFSGNDSVNYNKVIKNKRFPRFIMFFIIHRKNNLFFFQCNLQWWIILNRKNWVNGSRGIAPTMSCTHFLIVEFVVAGGGFYSYYIHYNSDKERKIVRKKLSFMCVISPGMTP